MPATIPWIARQLSGRRLPNDSPEFIYAKEMELGLAQMRHADPDNFFAAIKEFGANTVDAYWQEQSEG